MVSAATLAALAFVCSGVLPLVLVRPALRNRDKPGADGLLLVILGASVWSFTSAVLQFVATPEQWWVVANVRMLGVTVVVVGLVLGALDFTGTFAPTRRVVGGLAVYPALVQIAAWTNPVHTLFYDPMSAISLGMLVEDNGRVLFWTHSVVAFAMVFGAVVLLVVHTFRTGPAGRKQSLAVLASTAPPIVANLLLSAGVITTFDPSPPAFVATTFVMAWALFRVDLLDIVPVGRHRTVESMDDPVVTLDTEGRVVDCNPAARSLVDPGPDWQGMPADEFFDPFPDVRECLADGDPIAAEVSLETDGTERVFDLNSSPLTGSSDRQWGRLLVFRDITLLKERERELRERERTLRRKNEFLDEFATMVSHDVATPLNVIENKARLVEMTGETSHVEDIFDASERVHRLFEELRTLAREGEHVGDTEPVDLEEVTRTAWRSVQRPGATLAVASTRTLDADRGRLRQLLENLLDNAAEHAATVPSRAQADSPDHRPDSQTHAEDTGLGGAAETVTVEVGTFPDGFYVADDGPGIPESDRETVFEQGYTTAEDGSGLGLVIVERIAEGHDWTVDVTESEAGGARFEIRTSPANP